MSQERLTTRFAQSATLTTFPQQSSDPEWPGRQWTFPNSYSRHIFHGLEVMTLVCQAGSPGSIPGERASFFEVRRVDRNDPTATREAVFGSNSIANAEGCGQHPYIAWAGDTQVWVCARDTMQTARAAKFSTSIFRK